VLDAERQLFSAELQLATALRDRLNAVVSVCMALGGGWADPGKTADFPLVNTERLLREKRGAGKTMPAATPVSKE
jgi:multidrug efflux system outer membrane protein